MVKIWTHPGEVKGPGLRQCNCDDVMKNRTAKCAPLLHAGSPSVRRCALGSVRLASSGPSPRAAQGWQRAAGEPHGHIRHSQSGFFYLAPMKQRNGTFGWRRRPGADGAPAPSVRPCVRAGGLVPLASTRRVASAPISPTKHRHRAHMLGLASNPPPCLFFLCH